MLSADNEPSFENIVDQILRIYDAAPCTVFGTQSTDCRSDGSFDPKLIAGALNHILCTIYEILFRLRVVHVDWPKDFIKTISSDFDYIDIFTLNYDDLLDDIVDDPSDGFAESGQDCICADSFRYSVFNPRQSSIPANRNLVNHLHGSIHFSTVVPKGEKNRHAIVKYGVPQDYAPFKLIETQDGRISIHSSIVSGLDKVNALIHAPYNCYHANFVHSICLNRRLLVIGYGFGDFHINALVSQFCLDNDNRILVISPSLGKYGSSMLREDSLTSITLGNNLIHYLPNGTIWWFEGTFIEASRGSNPYYLQKILSNSILNEILDLFRKRSI